MDTKTVRLSHSRTLTTRYGTLTLECCSYGLRDCVSMYLRTKLGTFPVLSMEISAEGRTIIRPSLGSHTVVVDEE